MNFVFISPNFPDIYSHFVKALKERGITVLGIGDTPYNQLNNELKENLTEYCFCSNLANLDWMKNTVGYLKNKYGPIDYLESNNEFWLENDAELREYAGVLNGLRPKDMEVIKYKSKMKNNFIKAGVKVARYILVDTLENSEKFIEEVGYPVFAKPDNGVGASATYKISNHDELVNFHNSKPSVIYIMEEFLNGYITSFDGIANDESEVVLVFNETFPTPIAEVVHTGSDVYYYANMDMPKSFRDMGERVIKAFGIKKRCFHIEFFCLLEDKKGLGKKGDIIALETNMRSPGGNTPDLLCIAFNNSYYEVYADVIAYDKTSKKLDDKHYIAIAVSRRNNFFYKYNDDQIKWDYKEHIVTYGTYSPAIAPAMGDRFFFAKFDTIKEAEDFKDRVWEK